MRQITKVGKKYVKVKVADWEEMWRRLGATGLTRASGDCDDFCGAACANNDGCDFSFGSSPECGAYCNDGEVFLQEEQT